MKKMKKVLAMIMTLAMVFGMGLTAFAANGTPQNTDTAVVKITGMSSRATVTLYQIAKGEYGTNGNGFIGYNWATGVDFDEESAPTADEINEIAKGILSNPQTITPLERITDGTVSEDNQGVENTTYTYTKEVSAGAYIAIITGAEDGTIYNPILLTATYGTKDNESSLVGGSISAGSDYLYGSTAIAKSTKPVIEKTAEGTTADGEKQTASVGDVITYTIAPTIPDYPSNAINKTFFISDVMSPGLTFDFSSLTVQIGGQNITMDTSNNFVYNGKTVATAHNTDNGFNLSFDYNNLISDEETGAVYNVTVTYTAVINGSAVVGDDGNANNAKLFYANNPNSGSTYTDVEKEPDPETATDISKTEDSVTIYTYQLAFMKVDDSDPAKPLPNAVFGIYKNRNCTELVDTVITNENGYGVSTKVAAGTYYVKEIEAPSGYSLNGEVFEITANWTTATTQITGTVTSSTYTSEKPSEDAVQVGWMKNNVFYAMDEFSEDEAAAGGYVAAYIASATSSTTSNTTTSVNGGGTTILEGNIPNTSLSELPSTGGIGTTIFTVGGCVIMIAAAALFFMNRRKSEE